MMAKTHMVGGLLGGLAWCAVSPPSNLPETTIMLTGTVFGSILPDIDHPQSKIAKTNIIVGTVSRIITTPEWGKHRRFWHSIWACLIFGAAFFFLTGVFSNLVVTLMGTIGYKIHFDITQYAMLIGISVAYGCLWHLILDACTIEGWNPLWKPKFRICLLPIHTSSPLELIFRIALTAFTLAFAVFLLKQGIFDGVVNLDGTILG